MDPPLFATNFMHIRFSTRNEDVSTRDKTEIMNNIQLSEYACPHAICDDSMK